MEFVASVSALRIVLSDVGRVVPDVPSLVAYGAVLLQVSGSTLSCTASDGDTTVTRRMSVTGPVDGQVLVVAGPLVRYLANVTQSAELRVRVDEHGDVVVTVSGEGSYTFRSLNAAFPSPKRLDRGLAPVPLQNLSAAVKAVTHASSGVVLLSCHEAGVTVAATDSYRIAHAVLPSPGASGHGVVDVKALAEAARYPLDKVGLDTTARLLRFAGPAVSFTTRLQDTVFPDVAAMVDARPPHRALVARVPFEKALERLLAVAERTPLRVSLAGREMTMRAENVERGSGVEKLPLQDPVPEFEFGVNGTFLKEAVVAHASEQVELSWFAPLRPVYVRSQQGFALTTLLMPVRL